MLVSSVEQQIEVEQQAAELETRATEAQHEQQEQHQLLPQREVTAEAQREAGAQRVLAADAGGAAAVASQMAESGVGMVETTRAPSLLEQMEVPPALSLSYSALKLASHHPGSSRGCRSKSPWTPLHR